VRPRRAECTDAQVGPLGYPPPATEQDALRLALITLQGVREYAARTRREVPDDDSWASARELRKRVLTVESHCRNVLASMAAFHEEQNP
jgi:hypothetical protein